MCAIKYQDTVYSSISAVAVYSVAVELSATKHDVTINAPVLCSVANQIHIATKHKRAI